MNNLYEILQVNKNDSQETIEKSYKKLVKKYHPDIAKDKAKAEEIMKNINNAYDILGDEEKRKEYDEQLNLSIQNNNPKPNYTSNNNYNTTQYTNYNNTNNQYNYSGNDYNKETMDYIINSIVSSKKIFLIILLIVFILVVKLLFDIYYFFNNDTKYTKNNNNLTTSTSSSVIVEEEYIVNEELSQIFITFINNIKYYNLEDLNSYLANNNIIKKDEFDNMLVNKKIINNIVDNMQINITNSRSSNLNNGLIDIEIKRVNLDYVLLEVSRQVFLNYYQNYTQEDIYNLILQELKSYENNITTVKTSVKFTKENGEWKIIFNNYDFYNVFGFNIKQEL